MDVLFRTVDPVVGVLRPYLTPITTSLPAPIRDFAVSQVGPQCYQTTIERLDLVSSPECSKLLVSKTIGVGIVALSVFVKIPQLLKLLSSRSARGVSFASYLLEIAAQVITLAYNTRQGNPFSTYGEIAILALQNILVAALVLEFQGRRAAAAVFVAGIASAGYALFDDKIVDARMLQFAQAATIPLGLMSKVPQIWTVAKEKSTGQLSAFAVFNYLFGSLARVFTTATEIDDPVILYGFVGGAVLNVILAAQMVYYWNSGTKLGSGQPAKKPASSKGKGKKRA